jgi:Restriction endonuclease
MPDPAWRQFERKIAAAFSEAGMKAQMDVLVAGVRTTHRIDVLVDVGIGVGPRRLWIIESKKHRRDIEKHVVMTLRSVVEDIGAERGFVVSETGFQPSAVAAAAVTNITLCTIDALRCELTPARQQHGYRELEARLINLRLRLRNLNGDSVYPQSQDPGDLFSGAVNWKQWLHWNTSTAATVDGLAGARLGHWPATAGLGPQRFASAGGEVLYAEDPDRFLTIAAERTDAAERWVDAAERWLAVSPDDSAANETYRGLSTDLLNDFVVASARAREPDKPAGPTFDEGALVSEMLARPTVAIGYVHDYLDPEPDPEFEVTIWDRSLYFKLDNGRFASVDAAHWDQYSVHPRRLIFVDPENHVSKISTHESNLGRLRQLVFLADTAGVEVALELEFEAVVLYVWADQGTPRSVTYSVEGFPGELADCRPSRELR